MSDIVRDPYGNPLSRDKLITTLRAEVERLKEQLESPFMDGYETAKEEYRPRLIAAEAENERLRAVLEDIAYPNPLHNEDDLMRIARAALAQENTNAEA